VLDLAALAVPALADQTPLLLPQRPSALAANALPQGVPYMRRKGLSLRESVGVRQFVKYISIVVRNAMEDFHDAHLSDAQMKELNPIIRNAIYTALYAFETCERSKKAEPFVRESMSMIPPYWEEPQLLVKLED
jgi:hypothetical protein